MKSKVLLFILSTYMIFSCTDSDNTALSITDSDILGTWNITGFSIDDATILTSTNGMSYTTTSNIEGKDYNASISFSENPKEVELDGSITIDAAIGLYGENQAASYAIESLETDEIAIWSIANNLITLTDQNNDHSIVLKVLEYSENKILCEVSLTESIAENDITVEVAGIAIVILEK